MNTGQERLGSGIVYTETVVYSPPKAFASDAPYQIAIIALEGGGRTTARVQSERVSIGDRVDFLEFRGGIPFFQKSV